MTYPWSSGDVLTASDLNDYAGLILVKTQTIGTAVSSVTVTGAFSATFDNYRIIIAAVDGSAIGNVNFQLGSTITGYYGLEFSLSYVSGTSSTQINNGGPLACFVTHTANDSYGTVEVQNPYPAQRTGFTALSGGLRGMLMTGEDTNSTSHSAFTLVPDSGTLTGGTIKVYGYNNG